jgi:hypothetical protein
MTREESSPSPCHIDESATGERRLLLVKERLDVKTENGVEGVSRSPSCSKLDARQFCYAPKERKRNALKEKSVPSRFDKEDSTTRREGEFCEEKE